MEQEGGPAPVQPLVKYCEGEVLRERTMRAGRDVPSVRSQRPGSRTESVREHPVSHKEAHGTVTKISPGRERAEPVGECWSREISPERFGWSR